MFVVTGYRTGVQRNILTVALGCLLVIVLLVAGCGRSNNQPAGSSASSNTSQADSSSRADQETLNLDLKTSAEVMEYVKDMDPAKRHEVLLQGTKKEGSKITIYSLMSENDAQRLKDAFEKDNLGIELDIWRSSADELQVRFVNEFRANTHKVDVVHSLIVYSYESNKEGMITPYFAPNMNDFPKGLYDPNGHWAGIYVLPVNTVWNTELLPESDVPNTWEDLADPKYKGNFSLDVQENLLLFYLRKTRGEEAGTELAKKIAANEPRMIRSRSQQLALLSAGEFALTPAAYEQYTIQAMEKGAPIDFKYLDGPVLADTSGGMLVKNAPHPYSAVYLLDWMTSLQGQQAIADMGRNAALPGVEYPHPRQGVVLKEREVFELKAEEFGPVLEQTYDDFQRIFGLAQ